MTEQEQREAELAGLQVIAEASAVANANARDASAAEAANRQQRWERLRTVRTAGRGAAPVFEGVRGEEARELAALMSEATYGHSLDRLKVLNVLEALGVEFPEGVK